MYKLRELQREDIKEINKWRNDSQLIENLGAPYRYINEEIDMLWYENYLKNRNTTVRLAMIDTKNKILGLASITDIDYINRKCSVHFMIGDKKNRGKGLGDFAVKQILKHAFLNMNMNRVELNVLEINKIAIGLYQKNGFVIEGIRRNSNYKDGKYINMLFMSILKDEYMKIISK